MATRNQKTQSFAAINGHLEFNSLHLIALHNMETFWKGCGKHSEMSTSNLSCLKKYSLEQMFYDIIAR